MVQGGGFEPPKLARQIYSLIPLATREPLRVLNISAAFVRHQAGAGERNRTPDRLITSQLLYLLSYASNCFCTLPAAPFTPLRVEPSFVEAGF